MDHYIDIKMLPDAEMHTNVLLNNVYSKLHKTLFALKSIDIGVSFPQHKIRLGNIIRIHSSKERLDKLQNMNWLGGLSGYCNIGLIHSVPVSASFRVISRKQANMTQAKLNRLISRGSISGDAIKSYKAKMFSQGLDNPYLELVSNSNGQQHRRYIQFGEIVDSPVTGVFDSFGLSKTATVPWF